MSSNGKQPLAERTGTSLCFHIPTLIPEESPVAMSNISDGKMTIITEDPSQRYYHMMVFNNKYRVRVATRNVNIPGVQNFRDLGGYKSTDTGK